MVPASLHRPTYRCPGDAYDIPHPVHVARMAAGFDRCRDCRHRGDLSGEDSDVVAADAADTREESHLAVNDSRSPSHSPLFLQDGIRGVYLNEITRHDAGRIAGAFA